MRSVIAAAAAVLALSACSGEVDGGAASEEPRGTPSSDASPAPIDDVCALVSVEDASRIVGVPYEQSEVTASGDYEVCAYRPAAGDDQAVLTLGAGAGSLDESMAGLEMMGDATSAPLDVPGADSAALVTVDYGDNTIDQWVAEARGNVYVVTLDGESDVAAALLAAAIGSS